MLIKTLVGAENNAAKFFALPKLIPTLPPTQLSVIPRNVVGTYIR